MKPKPDKNRDAAGRLTKGHDVAKNGGAKPGAGRKSNALRRMESELWERHGASIELVVEKLVKIATTSKSERTCIEAGKVLLDRVFGKARQTHEVDVTVDPWGTAADTALAALQMKSVQPKELP